MTLCTNLFKYSNKTNKKLIQIYFEIISSLADGLVRRDERAGDVESGAHLLEDVHVGGTGSSKHQKSFSWREPD